MVVGLGVGLVDAGRFERALTRHGSRLARRVFTPGERAYAARRARGHESLAARFAAKCAARQALGGVRVGWQEVEVVREPGRPPGLALRGRALEHARARGIGRWTLSLTHDGTLCLAHVIAEDAS